MSKIIQKYIQTVPFHSMAFLVSTKCTGWLFWLLTVMEMSECWSCMSLVSCRTEVYWLRCPGSLDISLSHKPGVPELQLLSCSLVVHSAVIVFYFHIDREPDSINRPQVETVTPKQNQQEAVMWITYICLRNGPWALWRAIWENMPPLVESHDDWSQLVSLYNSIHELMKSCCLSVVALVYHMLENNTPLMDFF